MADPSKLELSSSALRNNLEFIRNRIEPSTRISAVVKANAYGHGIEQFVPMLESEGIHHFSVFSYQEALRVREAAGPNASVMIMGWLHDNDLRTAISEGMEFYISDLDRARAAFLTARELRIPARVHFEIETGMNRTGLRTRDISRLAQWQMKEGAWFNTSGACTHLAGAENVANFVRIRKQRLLFHRACRTLANNGIRPAIRHMACSAGILNYPDTQLDLVRAGILLYGYWPSPETFIRHVIASQDRRDPLRRVIRWTSAVMSIKDVSAGDFIGYGSAYLATDDRRIAIIPVGYSDGFTRTLSNQGRVLIRGEAAPVIGLVNMNMLMADITYLPAVQRNDEVVLIGKQLDAEITVASFSEMSDRLNYEALVRLPEHIHRTIVK
ncbi:MAG: alanine racemase [Bacteroidales bacterium]|nr:alanine racemase [Bacteroidales bacterium]